MAESIALIVGTYADSGGRGLYPLGYDAAAEQWSVGDPVTAIANASFGVQTATHTYLVDEAAGAVTAYRGAADDWRLLAAVGAGGGAPCHLALHPSGRWLAVAHYHSGSVAIFALDPQTGAPSGPVALHAIAGHGPDPRRQLSAHAHWVGFSPDGATLWCVDLGTDRILAFEFDAVAGSLSEPVVAYTGPAGSGPRHLLFHPTLPLAYLVGEMAATLTVLHCRNDGGFDAGTVLPTLSGDFAGENIAGGIALNLAADRLYVTNRGDDSVAIFALDSAGEPTWAGQVPSGGRSPRFVFVMDDQRRLLVAHEGGPTVTAFRITADGLVDPLAIPIPGAAFILPAA